MAPAARCRSSDEAPRVAPAARCRSSDEAPRVAPAADADGDGAPPDPTATPTADPIWIDNPMVLDVPLATDASTSPDGHDAVLKGVRPPKLLRE